ncbi:hypothetical protein POM88_041266 [Heracleum sosnowskyi]|uniref:DUF4283 domain-containing protein n=1 Tax=Heracleum sosnowskyi TaxID=360622 RepID=A0AAD8HDW3_9APIA|nr:hypothetical protein POM88_041266 [Heracleum sosnowskyi]
MGSQDSNVNSDGVPVDHDGGSLEFGIEDFGMPLESHGMPSSSGGIPVEQNLEASSEEEEFIHEDDRARLERESVNRTARAAFAVNREERNELIALRLKYQEMQKGISLVDMEKEALNERVEFNSGITDASKFISGRDEFGLLVFTNKQGLSPNGVGETSGVREAIGQDRIDDSIQGGLNLFEGLTKCGNSSETGVKAGVSGAKDVNGKEFNSPSGGAPPPKSWANVLKSDVGPGPKVRFDYYPFPPGTHSFKTISAFARNFWDERGLLNVFQKDANTFVFKFNSEDNKNAVLSRGTWYVSRRPMIVTAWGFKPGVNCVSSMPLWIKLTNVPDCYWTIEGLGRLSSVVGTPIGADTLTSKLELLPFAKMCVNYKLGDPLPSEILATDLDPFRNEKSVVKVQVSYPVRPLSCAGYKSLGHSIAACPIVTRVWVQKVPSPPGPPTSVSADINACIIEQQDDPLHDNENVSNVPCSPKEHEHPWTEVKRKNRVASLSPLLDEASPTPPPYENY